MNGRVSVPFREGAHAEGNVNLCQTLGEPVSSFRQAARIHCAREGNKEQGGAHRHPTRGAGMAGYAALARPTGNACTMSELGSELYEGIRIYGEET